MLYFMSFLFFLTGAGCIRFLDCGDFVKKSKNYWKNLRFAFNFLTSDPDKLKSMYLKSMEQRGKCGLIEFKLGRFVALPIDEEVKIASLRYEFFAHYRNGEILNLTPPPGYEFELSASDLGANSVHVSRDRNIIYNTYCDEKVKFPPDEAHDEEELMD